MSSQTTPGMRQRFYSAHVSGSTYQEIAEQYGVSLGCVRYWCRRQRDGGDVQTQHMGRQPGLLQQFEPAMQATILSYRAAHPRWGPGLIHYKLACEPALKGLRRPSIAQIGRFLHRKLHCMCQHAEFRRRTRRAHVPPQRPAPPNCVHQRWQIDFKSGIPLQDGTQVNLHTVRDPFGEVCLAACVTPAGPVGQVPRKVSAAQVQATLRSAFARWRTLPQEVQSDSETVLVGKISETYPSPFTLWLVGLGIAHLLSRPGTPTDNAEVERCHQTVCNCAIIGDDATDLSHLQQVLDQTVTELAFGVPSHADGCHNQPPVVAHPQLLQPLRPFSPEQEWAHFDLRRVDAYLAGFLWLRKVGDTGRINLGRYCERYSVGRAYAGQHVLVCFDPDTRHYVFFQDHAPYAQIGSRPARGLTVERLTGLSDPDAKLAPQQLPLPLELQHG